MTDTTTTVEGLSPWLASGELTAILAVVAAWYDATDEHTNVELFLKPWAVHPARPDLDLKPMLGVVIAVELETDDRAFRSLGRVRIWPGATPERVRAALAECESRTRDAAREKQQHGSNYLIVHGPDLEVAPEIGP